MPQDNDQHDGKAPLGLLSRALRRSDIMAAVVVIAIDAWLWWLGVRQRALPWALSIWTVPLNLALILAGLFGAVLLRPKGRVFDSYVKWVVIGPLVATVINIAFLVLAILAAEPWRRHSTVGP